MFTPTTAFEDSSLPLMAAGDAQATAGEARPDRRREFEAILSRTLPRLQRMALRSLRNPEDAEDAVQDAMLLAFRHIAQFDGRAQMSTWLTAIVLNTVRMQLRRRPRGQMVSLDQSPAEGKRAISELLADPSPTPEQNLEQRQLLDLVTKLTGGLPASQRAALQLRLKEDSSIKDAARKLRVPEGTLKAQLTRGRVALAQRFHKAIRAAKPQTSVPSSIAKSKTSASDYARDGAQVDARLPITVFTEQGACQDWIA